MLLQSKDYTATAVQYHHISGQWNTTSSTRSKCFISLFPPLFILSRSQRTVHIMGAGDQMFHLSQNATVQCTQYNYTISRTSSSQFILQVTSRSSAIWKEYHDLSKINHKKGSKACDSCLFLSFTWLYVSWSRSWRSAWTENWKGALWESWPALRLHAAYFTTETFF